MRILYQFPLSHFCEKARWLLDYKELDYIAQNLTPGLHQAFAQLKTGQRHLPILRDKSDWIADATAIAEYLDQSYPEYLLFGTHTVNKVKILQVDADCNALGADVRQWLFRDLSEQDHAMEIVLGEQGYLRKFSRLTKPMLKTILNKGFHLNTENQKQLSERIQSRVLILNDQFLKTQKFMVGQRFSLADIAVCSMLAPLLNIEATPWESDVNVEVREDTLALKNFILDLPLGQYVIATYANYRNARVDWRGV